ncbi:hypothetical protein GF327_01305 [Candidatus Woesearchaeota archaeon]|nr:hypothetical protein [Candidatus Woesearchaeota archaeon]
MKFDKVFKDYDISRYYCLGVFMGWFDIAKGAGLIFIDDSISDGVIFSPYTCRLSEAIDDLIINAFAEQGFGKWEFPTRVGAQNLEMLSSVPDETGEAIDFLPHTHTIVRGDCEQRVAQAQQPIEVLRPAGEAQIYPFWKNNVRSYRDLGTLLGRVLLQQRFYRVPSGGHSQFTKFERPVSEGHALHKTREEATHQMFQSIETLERLATMLGIPYLSVESPKWDNHPFNERMCYLLALLDEGVSLFGSAYNQGTILTERFGIQYQDRDSEFKTPFISTFGVGLLYKLMMTNLDQKGFILPPEVAPIEIVILPINPSNSSGIEDYVREVEDSLVARNFRVKIDRNMDERLYKRREKYEQIGVPIRLEIGKNEFESDNVSLYLRWEYDERQQLMEYKIGKEDLVDRVEQSLFDYSNWASKRNSSIIEERIVQCTNTGELREIVEGGKVGKFYWCGEADCINQMYGKKDHVSRARSEGSIGIGKFLGWDTHSEDVSENQCIQCSQAADKIAYWSKRA